LPIQISGLRFGLGIFPLAGAEDFEKGKQSHRICKVLESTNPNPSTNGYSRVVSWIDEETLGIVQAYAYDAQGRKLKEFYPRISKRRERPVAGRNDGNDNVQTRLSLAD
jgi:YD repeat-containing protein